MSLFILVLILDVWKNESTFSIARNEIFKQSFGFIEPTMYSFVQCVYNIYCASWSHLFFNVGCYCFPIQTGPFRSLKKKISF